MKKWMKRISGFVGATALLYLFAVMPRMLHRADKTPFEGVHYAHRGLYDNVGVPENSLAAFQKAVDHGYGIELDVQLTKDKKLVVFHDFDLKRMCGVDKKVEDMTYAQLQQLTLLDTQEKIPKLKEVLQIVDGKVPLIIEYKIPGTNPEVCEKANGILQRYQGVYCVESFNPLGVLWYRLHEPDVFRGILSDSFVKEGFDDFPKPCYEVFHHMLLNFIIKPDFIAYHVKYESDLSRQVCKKLFKAPAVAWTIQSEEELNYHKNNYDLFIFEGFLPEIH